MWKEGNKVIFITKVVERKVIAISNAAVELRVAPGSATAAPVAAASSIAVPGFGASQVFQGVEKGLASLSKEERLKVVKKTNAVFAFVITNAEKKTASWYIDVKNGEGKVGSGAIKADMTISVQGIILN